MADPRIFFEYSYCGSTINSVPVVSIICITGGTVFGLRMLLDRLRPGPFYPGITEAYFSLKSWQILYAKIKYLKDWL